MKAGPLADSAVTASMCFPSTTTVRPTERKMPSASSRCSGVACAPAARPVIPFRSSAGVLGIARTTGTACARCFSMNDVLTEAATEMRSCEGVSTSRSSPSTCGTVWGFTLRITMSAARAASAFESVPSTPRSSRSLAIRCACPAVTVMSPALTTPASSSPRINVSPSLPAPSTANFFCLSMRRSSGDAGAGATRAPRGLRRRVRAPVVEAAAGLAAVPPRQHHALEQRWRREARLLELVEHDLRDVVGGVEPDVVAEQQGAHRVAAAELHRVVDVVAAREPLLVDAHRVQHVGDQQAVHDEPGRVPDGHDRLAGGAAPVRGGLHGGLRGVDGLDDLDQLHELDGIEEVKPKEAVGTLRERAHLGDREARGVRGEDGTRLAGLLERAEDLALEPQVLAHRLDHEVAVGEILELGRALEVRERLVHRLLGHLALLDPALEELLDHPHPLGERLS